MVMGEGDSAIAIASVGASVIASAIASVCRG